MMKLMMEVRYDKDGPMGEKTDRRVRTNHYLSFAGNKIYQFQKHISTQHISRYIWFLPTIMLQLLFLEWAHPRNFYKKQPLWLIKRYFGDKVFIIFLVINIVNIGLGVPFKYYSFTFVIIVAHSNDLEVLENQIIILVLVRPHSIILPCEHFVTFISIFEHIYDNYFHI